MSHPLRDVAVRTDDQAGTAVAFDDPDKGLLTTPLDTKVIEDNQVVRTANAYSIY